MKKLIIFDLDGTLAESKGTIDSYMAMLLHQLISIVKVAIISGGDWIQFERQVLAKLPTGNYLTHLSILPTCGTKYFQYKEKWKKMYSEDFTVNEKSKIISSFEKVIKEEKFEIEKIWGKSIDDRGSQITYSALGQLAPLEHKKKWDPDFAKRKKMKVLLDQLLPEFSIRLGGTTSIDVTKKGIDKAYGILKLQAVLGISIQELIFVGDAIFPGGNDYPAKEAGALCIQVRDPEECKRVMEAIIACMDTTKSK